MKRPRTDRYPVAVPRTPFGDPPRARMPRMVDAPIVMLDTPETPRERTARLALARARFIADERARERRRNVVREIIAAEQTRARRSNP